MPVENTCSTIPEQIQVETAQVIKLCSSCSHPLVDSPNAMLVQDDHDSNAVCVLCNMRLQMQDDVCAVDGVGTPLVRATIATQVNCVPPLHIRDEGVFVDSMDMDELLTSSLTISSPCTPVSVLSTTPSIHSQPSTLFATKPMALSILTHSTVSSRPVSYQSRKNNFADAPSHPSRAFYSSPDPLIDITHIRVRSQNHHCLYPGSMFQGTQKSGRNSYDVTVSIVDVDFTSSFLCGYLRIRGLTDDWPELTTYFDAEIIGSRYGFLTQNWGANEQEDMLHWQRFPAFRHVKNEMKVPNMTISDRDRGAVFMRWKERFLVPDHKVQDISGASFAGFYYVCVDFNPHPHPSTSTLRPGTQLVPLEKDEINNAPSLQSHSFGKTETVHTLQKRRDSSVRRGRGLSVGPRSNPPAATMSGFYFHQNSEPYQQLSLSHVPERFSSSFEFR